MPYSDALPGGPVEDPPSVGLFDPAPRSPAHDTTGPIRVDGLLVPANDTIGLVAFWRDRAHDAERDAGDTRRRIADLAEAAERRRWTDQALGVLTVVFDLDPDAAADVLSWTAQQMAAPPAVAAERFVDAARTVRYREDTVEELTQLLADLIGDAARTG